jgi:hypothetical protein
MALKLASFRYLRANGYSEACAHNDTASPPILALNEKLGYQRLPGWLAWERPCKHMKAVRGCVLSFSEGGFPCPLSSPEG